MYIPEGQDVFHVQQKNKYPRTYYLAVASTGARAIRGSARDKFTHAFMPTDTDYKGQLVWGAFSSSEELAKRHLTRAKNQGYENYEVVPLTKISAREVRAIKKENLETHKKHFQFKTGIGL